MSEEIQEMIRRVMSGPPPKPPEWLDPLHSGSWKMDIPNKLQGYRNRAKDQEKTWKAANGVVRQVDFVRYYTGTCRECGCEVTVQRDIKRYSRRQETKIGRWPAYCEPCRAAKRKQHNKDATQRMRDLRARRKAAKLAGDEGS
ncbi:hypothetical protein [Nocardia sp. NPDC002869]|uniref:hypothetical protein n=1 Tax=Nocardia sp. NPDC002869 TaxID=3161032 RepID=UPI00398CE848